VRRTRGVRRRGRAELRSAVGLIPCSPPTDQAFLNLTERGAGDRGRRQVQGRRVYRGVISVTTKQLATSVEVTDRGLRLRHTRGIRKKVSTRSSRRRSRARTGSGTLDRVRRDRSKHSGTVDLESTEARRTWLRDRLPLGEVGKNCRRRRPETDETAPAAKSTAPLEPARSSREIRRRMRPRVSAP